MRWVDKYKSTNNITRKKRDYTSFMKINFKPIIEIEFLFTITYFGTHTLSFLNFISILRL